MKIAVPTAQGKLAMHFGHCESFTIIDATDGKLENWDVNSEKAPPHEPGLLPTWLAEKGVDLVIAGGMGMRAQNLFSEKGIQVIIGASGEMTPEEIVESWFQQSLKTGANPCDH
jgi:predicted Fe-Mo cluster-binding NifX family protein